MCEISNDQLRFFHRKVSLKFKISERGKDKIGDQDGIHTICFIAKATIFTDENRPWVLSSYILCDITSVTRSPRLKRNTKQL